jgi:hypothetical protein
LHLIGENGDKTEINNEIQAYVALYQREHIGTLPNNMAILYDYLTLVGDTDWYAAPAASAPLTGPQVISSAVTALPAGAAQQTVNVSQPASASTSAKAKAATKKSGGQ